MIPRTLTAQLLESARYYPVVTVTGPRQSGKTTVCRAAFRDHQYLNLERLSVREFALNDPQGFIASCRDGAIIDEVQRAPELLSAIMVEVDERGGHGRFILTGSQNLSLSKEVSQSLAGRTSMHTLHPPSLQELHGFGAGVGTELLETLWSGAYPRIHDEGIPAHEWLDNYLSTYLDRDVRQLSRLGDLSQFRLFMQLCAGSTGQELNLSRLGADTGVSNHTARAWLSVLEASYLVTIVGRHHANLRKRLVKRPKLHFLDSGLVCALLGIRSPLELMTHSARGGVFESWVVSEVLKHHHHRGRRPRLTHFRESKGLQVDLLVNCGRELALVETKSGATLVDSHLEPLRILGDLLGSIPSDHEIKRYLVYGGESSQRRTDVTILPWSALDQGPWMHVA